MGVLLLNLLTYSSLLFLNIILLGSTHLSANEDPIQICFKSKFKKLNLIRIPKLDEIELEYGPLEPLSSGGFGEVFIQKKPTLQRTKLKHNTLPNNFSGKLAIKIGKTNALKKELEIIKWEARMIEIVSYYDSHGYFIRGGFDPNLNALVTEFIDSVTLEDLFINGFNYIISKKFISQISTQLKEALEILRRARIVHGDIKPKNILIKFTEDEKNPFKIKIVDFGAAAPLDEFPLYNHSKNGPVGERFFTAEYASLEQIRQEPAAYFDDEYAVKKTIEKLKTLEKRVYSDKYDH